MKMEGKDASRGLAPPGSEEDLRQRLSLLSPADTVRGMLLNGVLEVVRELGDEAAVRQCLEMAGEKKLVDFFSYPAEVHLKMLYTAAQLLSGRYGSFEETLWNMGYQGARNFLSSTPGKLLKVLAQGNPKRLLNGLPSAFSVGGGRLQSTVRWTGPNTATFVLERDFLPLPYTEGVLRAAFEATQVKGFQVRSRQPEPLVGEYDLSWE
jgi:uncharacterized protein (TIGR02265 family)